MKKDKLTTLVDRLKGIDIIIECSGNFPWIYLDKVNGNKVTEKGNGGEHGYVIGWYPIQSDDKISLADDMDGVFDLIRKYK